MSYMQSTRQNRTPLNDMVMERNKKRVLVVDDDPMVRDLVCKMFAGIGLKTVPAENGREAYELFQQGVFDLVVTDLEMPVMDGFSLIRKLRRQSSHIPVVVITGLSDDLVHCDGEVMECIILHKPFTLRELTQASIKALDAGHYGKTNAPRYARRGPVHITVRP